MKISDADGPLKRYREVQTGMSAEDFIPVPGRYVQQRNAEFWIYRGIGSALAGNRYLATTARRGLSVRPDPEATGARPTSKRRSVLTIDAEVRPSAFSLACATLQHGGKAPSWQSCFSDTLSATSPYSWNGSQKGERGSSSMT